MQENVLVGSEIVPTLYMPGIFAIHLGAGLAHPPLTTIEGWSVTNLLAIWPTKSTYPDVCLLAEAECVSDHTGGPQRLGGS